MLYEGWVGGRILSDPSFRSIECAQTKSIVHALQKENS